MINKCTEFFVFIQIIFINTIQLNRLPEKYKNLISFLFWEKILPTHRLLNLLSVRERYIIYAITDALSWSYLRREYTDCSSNSSNYEALTKLEFNSTKKILICFKKFSITLYRYWKNQFSTRWNTCSFGKNNSFVTGLQVQ